MVSFRYLIGALLFFAAPLATLAQDVESHHEWLQNLERASAIDIEDPPQVLAHVLQQLPNPIPIRPTEHYSYFKFVADGLPFQGNLRIEPETGQVNTLHFAYFLVPAPWHDEDIGHYRVFAAEDGLTIAAVGPLTYRVNFAGIQRDLKLNDIRTAEPPKGGLPNQARFIGQVHDESGLRFWLAFEPETNDFAYFLDTNAPFSERLHEDKDLSGIFVGLRTGFVFLRDPDSKRLRLIGVHQDEIARNTYYDGPFDQLPDGYQTDFRVGDALALVDPSFADEVDAYGNFVNRPGSRVVVAPYIRYSGVEDLASAAGCLEPAKTATYSIYVNCLAEALYSHD